MNYKEYEAKANQTPIYNPKVAIPYVVIGLAGEMGETFEKMKDEANIEDVALVILYSNEGIISGKLIIIYSTSTYP